MISPIRPQAPSPPPLSPDRIYRQAAAAGARPAPLLTVSEWAERHRVLSTRSSAEPGHWRNERTPYLCQVMDCLSPSSPFESVVLMKGSQLGGTECGNNWTGFVMHYSPGPMLTIQPTLDLAKRYSKQRIDTLIEESDVLRGLVRSPRSRDSGNSRLLKEFPGGMLAITGANSAAGLRSMAARFIFGDEVDQYPGDVGGEGDPISLARARSRTFSRRKEFWTSSPKIAGLSRIQNLYDESDQRKYWLPCPECGNFQTLEWIQIEWPKDRPREAVYVCVFCKARLQNHRKAWMLPRGEWRPGAEGDGKTAGFLISSLYSPWFTWGEAAAMFVKAQKDPARLQVFVNTVLAETWQQTGEAPEWQRLRDRAEDFPLGKVPAGAYFLTAGADVQADRIEVQVTGWGPGRESWMVDYLVLEGSTERPEVWDKLTEVLNRQYVNAAGASFGIARLAVDSGYATAEVYGWARRQGPGRVIVIKGQASGAVPLGLPFAAEVGAAGKRIKRGVRVWPIATGLLKSELYGWLKLDRPSPESGEPFPPGFVHLPKMPEEFFKQLTAEQLITRVVKGYRKPEWMQTRPRNEALDTRVYARAAAIHYGIDRFGDRHWRQLGAPASQPARPPHSGPPPPAATAAPPSLAPPPAAPRPPLRRRVIGRFL